MNFDFENSEFGRYLQKLADSGKFFEHTGLLPYLCAVCESSSCYLLDFLLCFDFEWKNGPSFGILEMYIAVDYISLQISSEVMGMPNSSGKNGGVSAELDRMKNWEKRYEDV